MELRWPDFLLLIGILIASLIYYGKWKYKYWIRNKVPHVEANFPMGNYEVPWALKEGLHQITTNIYNELKAKGYKYGGAYSFFRPIFIPVDLDLIKRIFIKDFQYFTERGMYYNGKADPLSEHLFNVEGTKWKPLRIQISPFFSSSKLKSMFPTVLNCGNELAEHIEKLLATKGYMNIREIGANYTTNVIGACFFDVKCNCFENANNELRRHNRTFFKNGMEKAMRIFAMRSFPSLCRMLGILVIEKEITDFYAKFAKEIFDHRESNAIKKKDLVQLLIDNKDGTNNKQKLLTFEQAAGQCLLFFVAGFETSSLAMTYVFYEISQDQKIQDKMREEVRRTIEKYGGKITCDAIMEMTYMSQVFTEAIRKYPVVPTLERLTVKDYKIPGEDVVIEKGTKVLISVQGIHHDPDYYPDPQKFDPDRFSPENKQAHHACSFLTFGEGPRNCPGSRFAVMQSKVAMAIMLKDYRFTLKERNFKMKLTNKSQLLAPDGEVLINIERIN